MKKASVVIGRFEPVHNGHLELFRKATADCDLLVVVLGSAERPPDIKNPFTDHDRAAMIGAVLETDEVITKNKGISNNLPRFSTRFIGVPDYLYSDVKWITELRERVYPIVDGYEVTLFGHKKDDSSYYLDMFPEWKLSNVDVGFGGLSATDVRDAMFKFGKVPDHSLPHPVLSFINHWLTTPIYERLKAEWHLVKKNNVKWSSAPYPVSFTTADAVVIHKGHVLMVERGVHPGKGLLALPGGHLNVKGDNSLLDTALRELQEETGLVLSRDTVFNRNPYVFDAPNRSVRGRYITNVFMWVLNGELPSVVGNDDAVKALWIPLNDIHRKHHLIFEDHAEIIESMLGKI